MASPQPRKAPAKLLSGTPSSYVAVDGYRVHYKKVGGGGPVLLFVHGWACDHSFWRQQAEHFKDRATLLFVDLPGHGRSDKPQVAYTHDLFANALAAVLDDAGASEAVLVGHSVGGSIVRQLYRRFPNRSRAIVLVDATLRPFWREPEHLAQLLELMRGPEYLKGALGLVEMMVADHTPAVAGLEIRLRMLTTPQHVMAGMLAAMDDPALWAEDPIERPVLALLSRSSRYRDDQEAFLRRVAPDLDLRWLDGVGHFMMLTQPDVVNGALSEFLAAHAPAS